MCDLKNSTYFFIYLLIGMTVVSYIALAVQDYIVTRQIKARDPQLFEQIGGKGYASDVLGLYGGIIIFKVLRGLRGRKELVSHFKAQYYIYLSTLIVVLILMTALVITALIHDYVCSSAM